MHTLRMPKILNNQPKNTKNNYMSRRSDMKCSDNVHYVHYTAHFMRVRSRYSNRAVAYFNTTVSNPDTLTKQSVLKHNFDFGSIA